MAQITSRKISRTHGGKHAEHMDAPLSDTYPVVFGFKSGCVFNFSDGERTWNLHLSEDEAAIVAARFAEVAARRAAVT